MRTAPWYAAAYHELFRLEIWTKAPVWGASMKPAADVDAHVAEPGSKKTRSPGASWSRETCGPASTARRCSGPADAEPGVHPHGQAGAVEAGRARAAPHVRHAQVLLAIAAACWPSVPAGGGLPGRPPDEPVAAAAVEVPRRLLLRCCCCCCWASAAAAAAARLLLAHLALVEQMAELALGARPAISGAGSRPGLDVAFCCRFGRPAWRRRTPRS